MKKLPESFRNLPFPGALVLIAIALLFLQPAQAQDDMSAAPLPAAAKTQTGTASESARAELAARAAVDDLEKPLYSPFIERYVLDELKQIRTDMQAQRADFINQLMDREFGVTRQALDYSLNTVTYFFYVIAGASTLLVLVGWTSIRDIKERFQRMADERVGALVQEYEARLIQIEESIQSKTDRIAENEREIERTNELHSLWLKANQEPLPQNKIAIYDRILSLRPGDVEAFTYKADAALSLGEARWALSLADRAVAQDPENAHAHYQRACARAALNMIEEALDDLRTSIDLAPNYRIFARTDEAFDGLSDNAEFIALTDEDGGENPHPDKPDGT